MAQKNKTAVKLLNEKTGYFYVGRKNPKTHTEKMKVRKYDPVSRTHEMFVEKNLRDHNKK